MIAALVTVFVVAVAIMLLALGAVMSLSSIVEHERRQHPDRWLADGAPAYFGEPDRAHEHFKGHVRLRLLLTVWLFSPPSWVRADPYAARQLRRARLCTALLAVLAVGLIIIAAMLNS